MYILPKFKSRKCLISFSRDYTSQGEKNKKALKNQGFSWLYLFYSPFWGCEWGIFFVNCLSEEDGFGLFAIRRSDTTNNAMFDPDFCGVWVLSVAVCFFRLFFSHDYDFSSPQNRFKGPKVVRLKSLATSRSERKNSVTRKGN